MSINSFDQLLSIVGQLITKQATVMRKPVSPEERLAVTLMFLATGNSFASIHFQYLLGRTTIGCLVKETCEALWESLLPIHLKQKTTEEWEEVANQFYRNTKFPNCVGAIDGKHVRIRNVQHSGSMYFNYKPFFSIVLLGLVDADYCFTAIDVGAYGKSSDSNVFKDSVLGQKVDKNKMNFPPPKQLPNDDNGTSMPFVIVGDEAFALSARVIRSYPQKYLTLKKKVFNYRLTGARRMVECTFGIMANKWRIFHKAMEVDVDFAQLITQTCCVLHNFVRNEDGFHFEDTLFECPLDNIPQHGVRGDFSGVSESTLQIISLLQRVQFHGSMTKFEC